MRYRYHVFLNLASGRCALFCAAITRRFFADAQAEAKRAAYANLREISNRMNKRR